MHAHFPTPISVLHTPFVYKQCSKKPSKYNWLNGYSINMYTQTTTKKAFVYVYSAIAREEINTPVCMDYPC